MGSKYYFRSPGIATILLVPLGMLHITVATLWPGLITELPLSYLGQFTMYLMQQYPSLIPYIFYAAWATHVIESLYAFYMAQKLDLYVWCCIKWTIQTFIYGGFSLRLLRSFKARHKAR